MTTPLAYCGACAPTRGLRILLFCPQHLSASSHLCRISSSREPNDNPTSDASFSRSNNPISGQVDFSCGFSSLLRYKIGPIGHLSATKVECSTCYCVDHGMAAYAHHIILIVGILPFLDVFPMFVSHESGKSEPCTSSEVYSTVAQAILCSTKFYTVHTAPWFTSEYLPSADNTFYIPVFDAGHLLAWR